MIALLLALYPARWRRRYGDEFRAVLESRPLGPFDVADVLIGALDARLTGFRFAGTARIDGGPVMMLRIGGFGAIAGGISWFVGLAAASAWPGEPAWLLPLAVGTVALLLALIGLSAFQAQRDATLAWAAFAIPAIGAVVSVVGLAGMFMAPNTDALILGSWSAWSVWIVGLIAMVVGSILFAVATIRAAVFSRRAAQSLAISASVLLIAFLGGLENNSATGGAWLVFVPIVVAFAGSWVFLGAMALRRDPIRAISPA